MSVFVQGYGKIWIPLNAPIMAPGHQGMAIEIEAAPSRTSGLSLTQHWNINGQRFGVWEKVWTPDELADVYELVHHQLHGYDPRGLDPRVEKTRLTVNR
jgi:hypothetical protein